MREDVAESDVVCDLAERSQVRQLGLVFDRFDDLLDAIVLKAVDCDCVFRDYDVAGHAGLRRRLTKWRTQSAVRF